MKIIRYMTEHIWPFLEKIAEECNGHLVFQGKEYADDLEHVYIRGKMNSNQHEISFWLEISLRCSASFLLVFAKVSKWYEIFMWT